MKKTITTIVPMNPLRLRSGLFVAALVLSPSLAFAINDGTETFSLSDEVLASGILAGSEGASVTDVQGWDFTVFSVAPDTEASFDIWDGAVESGNGVAFYETVWSNDVDFNALRISPTDGSLFDLNGIGLNLQLWNGTEVVNDQNATLQGLDVNGNAISGATLSLAVNDAELISFDTSGIAQFNQISAFRVTPSSSSYVMAYGFIDDIAVSNVIPEPSTTVAMAGFAALSLALIARRRNRKATAKPV